MAYYGDNSIDYYYHLNQNDNSYKICKSDLSLTEINKYRYLFHPLEFDRLLYKIDNNRLGKDFEKCDDLHYDRFSVHCCVNQHMAFPLNWETTLCTMFFNYSEYEDFILNIFDRDTVICSSIELFMKNKNIGIIIPNNFFNELLNHLKKYNYEMIDEKIDNLICVQQIKINECNITLYIYDLNIHKLYSYDEYIEYLKSLNSNYKVSIHTMNSFQTCLDYFKLDLIDKRYCCLRKIVSVVLSMYNKMFNIFIVNNKKYLYSYINGKLISIDELNDDFDKNYNLNLINGDDILLDENFRINIYHKGMNLSELTKNIKGNTLDILKKYINKLF